MLTALAKVAATLNVDHVANKVMERLYRNAPQAQGSFTRRFQILTYHKVSTDPDPLFAPLHPSIFEEQMRFLKKYYNVLPLAETVERCRRGTLPARAVVITFDDGYRDNYEVAFPILKKYALSATIFVATGVIGNGAVLWHDRVFDAFRFATVDRTVLQDEELRELSLETVAARERSLQLALDRARELYGPQQSRFVERLEDAFKPAFPADHDRARMLDWEQVREMHRAGIEFGSHTVTHPVLSRIPSEAVARELHESQRRLSDELGASVVTFAYPNGRAADYNDAVKGVLKECGYLCAVTTERGVNRLDNDPFELKRGQPWDTEINSFRLRFFLERHSLIS